MEGQEKAMILIKKFPAPSDLETLKKEAEEQGL